MKQSREQPTRLSSTLVHDLFHASRAEATVPFMPRDPKKRKEEGINVFIDVKDNTLKIRVRRRGVYSLAPCEFEGEAMYPSSYLVAFPFLFIAPSPSTSTTRVR